MAEKLPGTENVYVIGFRDDHLVRPMTPGQIDEMLTESLALQETQIDDFVRDLGTYSYRDEIINFGSLMRHLQSECSVHLSALAAAAIIKISELTADLKDKEDQISEMESQLNYWANR